MAEEKFTDAERSELERMGSSPFMQGEVPYPTDGDGAAESDGCIQEQNNLLLMLKLKSNRDVRQHLDRLTIQEGGFIAPLAYCL